MKKSQPRPQSPPPPETHPSWRAHAWRIALLWIALFAAYSNSFQAGLVFDNGPVISEDPRIRDASAANLHAIARGQYWFNNTTSGLYRPLTTLSYLFNYAVLGDADRPAGYHVLNFALHAVNAALVYALGLAIFADPLWALALAALWGLHPLLVESVTNIVGRADLLAALGVLAGLLCAIRAASATGSQRFAWLAGLGAAQAIGLFSKESAAILPAAMLLYDLAWPARNTWRRRAPAYAILAVPFAVFFAMRSAAHAHLVVNFAENPLIAADFFTARLTAVKVIGKFLLLFLWPGSLSADYSYNAVPLFGSASWEDAKSILALAICVAAIVFALRARARRPAMFFFPLFFFAAIAPTANIAMIVGSIMAERFMYLPAIGLTGCAVLLLTRWRPKPALFAIAALCIALGARTYARNFDWSDGVSLWSSAVATQPDAARSHNNLAFEYTRIPGRMPDASAEYRAALRIRPDYPEAHFNLGNALLAAGRLPDAIAEFEAAVRAAPAYVEARNNLGNALLQSGNLAAAIPELHAAVRLRPDYAEAHENLGRALFQSQRLPDAVAEFESAVRLRPGDAEAHANLGSALFQSGRIAAAIVEYQTATRLDPSLADAHYNLANALLQSGRTQEAIDEFETVLKIHPDPEVVQILNRLRK
ncbi:MAG: tetratricopeptide repeat protein [Acidobacteriia bacterium]|nr:tetratricopeptide repeat protein [Terriglobia bacterium]